jgi:hypothetical protein
VEGRGGGYSQRAEKRQYYVDIVSGSDQTAYIKGGKERKRQLCEFSLGGGWGGGGNPNRKKLFKHDMVRGRCTTCLFVAS